MDWNTFSSKKSNCSISSPVIDHEEMFDAGGYIRLVLKSPQFELILAKGEDQDQNKSQKITNYRSLFLRSRIIRVLRRKWLISAP